MCYLPAFLQGKHHRLCAVYLHIKHLPRFPVAAFPFLSSSFFCDPSALSIGFASSLILLRDVSLSLFYFLENFGSLPVSQHKVQHCDYCLVIILKLDHGRNN